ncbi:MAG: hypothetical protein HQ527_06920 [Cyanobacteria bacterium]|nr:hypothetical protein [Cyanobacteria bacterium bin.51]
MKALARNTVAVMLLAGVGVALAQQQLLVRLPPRLQSLRQAAASSGPAALSLEFSRPMERSSVEAGSSLKPPIPFSLQGQSNPLLLLPQEGEQISGPLVLELAGRDRRGLALSGGRWRWDPRPHLLAVVPVNGGEQVQVRQHDGVWTALTPVWPSIPELEPIADGGGLGLVSRDLEANHQVWRLPISQENLVKLPASLQPVRAGSLQPFGGPPLRFAQLSSNRLGELLVQAAPRQPGNDQLVLWERAGGRSLLEIESSGPVALLPQGGELIVPEQEGLALRTLPPRPSQRQLLPGSRDLSSFCPVAGRALLVRHWPDFRRSLELVEPGQAPRSLWLGSEGLVASACSRSGERVWALLIEGVGQPSLTLLALNREGQVLQRRPLEGWELEPGTGLDYDPTGDRLLLALRPLLPVGVAGRSQAPQAQAALIDATSLELTLLGKPVRQVRWLVAG